jgi:hypothetical protein
MSCHRARRMGKVLGSVAMRNVVKAMEFLPWLPLKNHFSLRLP